MSEVLSIRQPLCHRSCASSALPNCAVDSDVQTDETIAYASIILLRRHIFKLKSETLRTIFQTVSQTALNFVINVLKWMTLIGCWAHTTTDNSDVKWRQMKNDARKLQWIHLYLQRYLMSQPMQTVSTCWHSLYLALREEIVKTF